MKTREQLEKEFGAVEWQGKKYILTDQAEHTNRLLPVYNNYNNKDEDGNYWFEMQSPGIDENNSNVMVYWIFWTGDGNEDRDLDSFDYSDENIDRVEEA
jgi:hypothetical protein